MRILLAHSRYRVAGGEESYVERIAPALVAAGHRVETFILAGEDAPDLPQRLLLAGRMLWSSDAALRLHQVARRFRPDVVHAHNLYPHLSPSVLLAARREGAAVVMHLHNARLVCPSATLYSRGAPCHRCVPDTGAVRTLARVVARGCRGSRLESAAYALAVSTHRALRAWDSVDAFITPSRFLGDLLAGSGLGPERIHLVPNFAQPDQSPILDQESTRPAADERPPCVLYAGRLSEEKGVRVLLEAMEGVSRLHLLLAGDGPLLDEARHRVASRKLAVTVTGRLDAPSLAGLRRRSVAAVVPSLVEENAPFAALEAIAAGLPVVASARGGLPELVADAGLLVTAGDAGALRRALERIVTDTRLREACAARALERSALYRLDVHLGRLENVYAAASRCSIEEVSRSDGGGARGGGGAAGTCPRPEAPAVPGAVE